MEPADPTDAGSMSTAGGGGEVRSFPEPPLHLWEETSITSEYQVVLAIVARGGMFMFV